MSPKGKGRRKPAAAPGKREQVADIADVLSLLDKCEEQSRQEMVKQTEHGSSSEQTGAETQLTASQEKTSAPNEEAVRQLTCEE
eukprot:339585-Rhodomonas_salina.1